MLDLYNLKPCLIVPALEQHILQRLSEDIAAATIYMPWCLKLSRCLGGRLKRLAPTLHELQKMICPRKNGLEKGSKHTFSGEESWAKNNVTIHQKFVNKQSSI